MAFFAYARQVVCGRNTQSCAPCFLLGSELNGERRVEKRFGRDRDASREGARKERKSLFFFSFAIQSFEAARSFSLLSPRSVGGLLDLSGNESSPFL